MDVVKATKTIEKYKDISRLLGIHEDEAVFDEIIYYISNGTNAGYSMITNSKQNNKGKSGEADFQTIISNDDVDFSAYSIDNLIISNRGNILDFWHSLDKEEKNNFTIFELNIILYFISDQYTKYQKKDKNRIVTMINTVVKDKKMDNAYKNLIV